MRTSELTTQFQEPLREPLNRLHFRETPTNVRVGSNPEVELADADFRLAPKSRHQADIAPCLLCADFVAEVG
jgi:hypothetical protein